MNDEINRLDINPINENLDKIPPILYKYRTFDTKGYGVKMAVNGDVYFASGKEFNDPFECYFIPKSKLIDYDGERLDEYLRTKALFHFPNASELEIKQFIQAGKEQRQKLINGDPTAMDSVMEVQYKNFGIFALSKDAYSIPMWAYYSDSIKGFCVGFHVDKIGNHQHILTKQKQALILQKVNYQDDILQYNIDVNPDGITDEELEETEALYFTKSKHWQHESEYRLIFSNYVSKGYCFGTESVAEIIIGLRADEKKVEELVCKLKHSNSKAKLRQLVRSQTKFELGYEEITY